MAWSYAGTQTRREPATHERLTADEADVVAIGSNRAFALVFAVVFLLVGVLPLFDGEPPRIWSFRRCRRVFSAVALAKPAWLAPLNRAWFRLGLALQRIVQPVLLGIIYFAVVTPTGLLMRLTRRDPLRLRREPDAKTYWIPREPPGPDAGSMTRQF